ncbi:esterase [Bacillus subtilis]|nr:esterase [Bacillus subtilis]
MDMKHTLLEALGIEIVENTAERCVAVMPVDHRTVQPFGYLHGGASVALAETAASAGAQNLIDHTTQACVGLEINANHLKSVKGRNGKGDSRARSYRQNDDCLSYSHI